MHASCGIPGCGWTSIELLTEKAREGELIRHHREKHAGSVREAMQSIPRERIVVRGAAGRKMATSLKKKAVHGRR
jgi:hypothetical protein